MKECKVQVICILSCHNLEKIYGDDTPELKEMMKTHTQFFNTSNFFNTIITGIDLAIEEKKESLQRKLFLG